MLRDILEEYVDYVEMKPEAILKMAERKGISYAKFVKIRAPEGTKYRFTLPRFEHWMLVREGEVPVSAGFVGVSSNGNTYMDNTPSTSLDLYPDEKDAEELQKFFKSVPRTESCSKNVSLFVTELLESALPQFIIEGLIEEADRWDFVKQAWSKAPEDFIKGVSDPDAVLRQLVRADPGTDWPDPPFETRTRATLGDVPYPPPARVGPYSQWIVSRFIKGIQKGGGIAYPRFMEEDLPKVTSDLKAFERIKAKLPKEKRDINKIGSFAELFQLVEPYREELEAKEAEGEAEKLYDKDGWVILVPKTQEASCAYGAGTRWCTASRQGNYFDRYNRDGPLFIVIRKGKDEARAAQLRKEKKGLTDQLALPGAEIRAKVVPQINALNKEMESLDEGKKWQFHFPSHQFMDEMDQQISIDKFMQEYPFVGPPISSYLEKEGHLTLATMEVLDPPRVKEYLKAKPEEFKKATSLSQIRIASDPEMLAIANAHKPKDVEMFEEKGVRVIFSESDIVNMFDKDQRKWVEKILSGDAMGDIYHSADEFRYEDAEGELDAKNAATVQGLLNAGVDEEEVHDKVLTAYARAYESGEEAAYSDAIYKAVDREFSGRKWVDSGVSLFIPYSDFLDTYLYVDPEYDEYNDVDLSDAVVDQTVLDYERQVGRYGPSVDIDNNHFNEMARDELSEIELPEPQAQTEAMQSKEEVDAENIWNSVNEPTRAKWMHIAGIRNFSDRDLGLWNTLSGAHKQKLLNYYQNIGIVPDI